MRITAIKRQQKRTDRYSIYIDEKYTFSLSENEVVNLRLHQDQEITKQELDNLLKSAIYDKAYDRVLRYVGIRPRSEYEVRSYLIKKGYDESLQDQLISRLKNLDLVNDQTFAKAWLDWRKSSRSRRRVRTELLQKRISREIIDQVLADLSDEDEKTQLRDLIKQRANRYNDPQKLIAYLLRKGYNYNLIKEVIEEQ